MAQRLHFNPIMLRNFARRLLIFHQRIHHLERMESEDLRVRYRFGRPALNHLFDVIMPGLEEKSQRNQSISKEMQVGSLTHTLHLLVSADIRGPLIPEKEGVSANKLIILSCVAVASVQGGGHLRFFHGFFLILHPWPSRQKPY